MKLLVFSDIHSDLRALHRLMAMEADYYFCAGDLVNWGRNLDAVGNAMIARAEKLYVIPGNHETPEQIAEFCEKFGFHNFHGKSMKIDGLTVIGLGCSNPTPFETPGEYSEEQLAEKLGSFGKIPPPSIAILHCPPLRTPLDRITNLRHAGSRSVREFIEREQPRYFFCGHIHESAGVTETLGICSAMNVGKRGFMLDLDEQRKAGLL